MRRSFGRISPERTLDIRPAHQLEVLRGGRVVAILRDEQPARISRAKIADGDLDPIGFLRAVPRAGVEEEAPAIIFIGALPARIRSEERRVGTERVRRCCTRWSPYHYKK